MSFEVNGMKAFEVDDYYTIVAHNAEEAIKLHIKVNEADPEEIHVDEINPKNSYMFVSINDIPSERLKELLEKGTETKVWEGDSCILISKAEAMQYRNATSPYVLSVSSDLL
ncbi:hypothetical protein [Geosporobacter ferrireducens]|uniref:hypothetical protein n=1 Tax=Geosporobacter ferrireducens TaxID=1424294 RepID=UPI00139C468E|nr:hypothetical protein [Geosporobacter ferrireducens]MTI53797.1 hypothetical protein [Geosporobacter ferrireducens]